MTWTYNSTQVCYRLIYKYTYKTDFVSKTPNLVEASDICSGEIPGSLFHFGIWYYGSFTKIDIICCQNLGRFRACLASFRTDMPQWRIFSHWLILVPGTFSDIFFWNPTTSSPRKQPKTSKWSSSIPRFEFPEIQIWELSKCRFVGRFWSGIRFHITGESFVLSS